MWSCCPSASLTTSGFEKSAEFAQDNSYYINAVHQDLNQNPLLNFGDDDEETKKDVDSLIVQSVDKVVRRVPIDEDLEVAEMFEIPTLCSEIQSTFISGSECLIGLNQQMKLYINDKLFSN